jgi:cytochrome c-type biogenesis protein CcmF
MGIDPLTKSADNPAENMNLVRDLPNKMDRYTVTYMNDSAGHEKGRRYFNILFEEKNAKERFLLRPDVYLMKDNNMSSNPDIKTYLTHDIFTYISYALNPEKNSDTSTFKIHELSEGDTFFYRKGYIRLDRVVKNPQQNKFRILPKGPSVMAVLSVNGSDSIRREATPLVVIDSFQLQNFDDTVYAQNLFLRFAGITDDGKKIKIGIREPDTMIDFVTIKAYRFPYIILVWLGLIIMSIGFTVSTIQRAGITGIARMLLLAGVGVALFYLFLLAG